LPIVAALVGNAHSFSTGNKQLSFVPASKIASNSKSTTTTTSLFFFQDLLKSFAPKEETETAQAKQANDYDEPIAKSIEILNAAAETKSEDPDEVVTALEDLEKLMRKKCKAEPQAAEKVLENLNGSWRLIFTTGTKKKQDEIKGTVNYFPIKAVQSFDTSTDPFGIENGIYLGDLNVVKFAGPFDFDLVRRKLEFDFTSIAIFGFKIQIKPSDAAKIGSSTGLGSESNVKNSNKGKRPFFNWISADENIATARGGGGGLALWKRIEAEE